MRDIAIRRAITSAAACVVALCLPVGAAQARTSCPNASASAGTVGVAAATNSLRCLINVERRRHGLRPLRSNARLRHAAARHAHDMARRNFFAHVAPGGGGARARVARTGYFAHASLWKLGETLAWGVGRDGSPRALVRRLLHSPPHRAILLSPRFREIGVGVAFGAPLRLRVRAVTVALDLGARW